MKRDLTNEEKATGFKKFFTDKHNIFSLIAILTGIISIILFLVLPCIQIDLTPKGVALAKKLAESGSDAMLKYHESLTGIEVLVSGTAFTAWQNSGITANEVTLHTSFNIMMLVGIIIIALSVIGMILMTIFQKNNVFNKVILCGFVLGAILVLLTPVFFYAHNTAFIPSTRYEQSQTIYPFGSVNANADVGIVVSFLITVVASVAAGFTLPKPNDQQR